jgi:hypothetical protein
MLLVGQTIVFCRLPALAEGDRPRSAMVWPTIVNSIDDLACTAN